MAKDTRTQKEKADARRARRRRTRWKSFRRERPPMREQVTICMTWRMRRAIDHAADLYSANTQVHASINGTINSLLAHALLDLGIIKRGTPDAAFSFQVYEDPDGEGLISEEELAEREWTRAREEAKKKAAAYNKIIREAKAAKAEAERLGLKLEEDMDDQAD